MSESTNFLFMPSSSPSLLRSCCIYYIHLIISQALHILYKFQVLLYLPLSPIPSIPSLQINTDYLLCVPQVQVFLNSTDHFLHYLH